MLYNPPSGSTDPNAPYVGKDTAAGRQGSKLPPTVPEGTQREIVAIIAAAQAMGLGAPTNADLQQMLKAVRSGLLSRFPATGTADAIAIAPQPAYVGLVEGMRFRFKIPGAANSANTTTAPGLVINGLTSVLILRRDGTAPVKGDLKAGQTLEVEIDAAGSARASGPLSSDIITILAARNLVGGVPIISQSTPGTYTWIVPDGVTLFRSPASGGGGGGGGSFNIYSSASGGAGGGYADGIYPCKAGDVVTYVVGAGGTPGSAGGGNGGTGGTSAVSINGTSLLAATGGGGGLGCSTGTSSNYVASPGGGAPGTGSGGNIENKTGGPSNSGSVSGSLMQGGVGAWSPSGGQQSAFSVSSAGTTANGPGGGGGGASTNAAGAPGAPGMVRIFTN